MRIAASIDTHSDHPLAQAVVKFAEERGLYFPRSNNYQARTGRGAEAAVDGHHYFVGNHRSRTSWRFAQSQSRNCWRASKSRVNRSWW